MRIRIVKKLLAAMDYKIGQEFEVFREGKARLGKSSCCLPVYIIKVEGTERTVLKQDAEEIEAEEKEKSIAVDKTNCAF